MQSKRGGHNKRDWSEAEKIISENPNMERTMLAVLCKCNPQTKPFVLLCTKYGIIVPRKYKRAHGDRKETLPAIDYRAELEKTLKAITERTGIIDFKGREGQVMLAQHERDLQWEQDWRSV